MRPGKGGRPGGRAERRDIDRIGLVDRVLAGLPVERPPVSLWYHFGVQHGGGERLARLALDFFEHYDFDFLKVMNDYFYPMPDGLDAVRTRKDLERIVPLAASATPWREQLRALAVIRRALKGKACFLDTVFDPWQTLRRALAGENIDGLMEREPEATHRALGVITDNLTAYGRKAISAGAAGIFLSVAAGRELVTRDRFLQFVAPYARRVLEALAGLGRMNTAHLHGEDLHFEDGLDLPAAVFSWWDRGPAGPSLAAAKAKTGACVMGGIDHTIVTKKTPAYLREHVREARRLGGRERFFLAGGCSIDASVNPRAIRAIVDAAREPFGTPRGTRRR